MNSWDRRAMLRALGATLLGLVVVWLVTAASDEGQLTVGARAGRTLPLAPLASAVGVLLTLGTARVREEVRALEALGRSPGETARRTAVAAALPCLVVAIAMALLPGADVSAFYPRVARGDAFIHEGSGVYRSPTLGVRIDARGETFPLEGGTSSAAEELPHGARGAAAAATGLAALALALTASGAALARSVRGPGARRRLRFVLAGEALACVVLTLIAFQAAAARKTPAVLAVVPPLLLFLASIARLRSEPMASAPKTPA